MSVTKIGSLYIPYAHRPKMVIYFDDKDNVNPYRIYFEWYEDTECGAKKRKRLITKYADIRSCGEILRNFTYDLV